MASDLWEKFFSKIFILQQFALSKSFLVMFLDVVIIIEGCFHFTLFLLANLLRFHLELDDVEVVLEKVMLSCLLFLLF